MTQSPPPKSSSSVPSQPVSRNNNDEWIAVVVALLALGSIFFWIFSRNNQGQIASFQPNSQLQSRTSPAGNLGMSGDLEEFSPLTPSRPETVRPDPLSQSSLDVQSSAPLSNRTAVPDLVAGSAVVAGANSLQSDNPGNQANVIATPSPTVSPTVSPTESPVAPSTPISQPQTSASAYNDVQDNYWAKEFIAVATTQNIMSVFPDGTFRPDQRVSRGELANQINKNFARVAEGQGSSTFKDVPETYWADSEIQAANSSGFMKGYPGEVFRPEQEVPRVQVLVALVSGLNLQPPQNPEEVVKRYQDADQIPQWAVEKVATATEAGLVVNHPNLQTLNPNQPATRAEVAAMLYQAQVQAGQAQPIASEFLVQPKK
ncbi:MAG: S-layer homology domain-containing protein [Oscillatoriales cyanobacterium RM2_1_1]|nr:S-layer homology domain-containing protein [Oscillatoriales cyanobacterium SM2_3_0]NJO46862.1 S-layer homology domain-containing protein [Oscillatoriales cyanobacterium RM2_1_1]